MSNSLAIAAATLTLRNLLQQEIPARDGNLPSLNVTTLPAGYGTQERHRRRRAAQCVPVPDADQRGLAQPGPARSHAAPASSAGRRLR